MRRAVAAAGWVVLAAGCEQSRTELVARVDSEIAWGAGRTVQSVTLTVRRGGPTGPLRSARTTALGMGGERRPLPLLVGIVPTDDTDTPVWIEALGCRDPNGCTAATAVVAQRAVVRFTVGQTQEVPLLLASACVGVTCAGDERCGTTGRCEPATRATVRPFAGVDSGTMADAVMDAGVDRIDVATPDWPVAMDRTVIADTSNDAATMADQVMAVDAPTVDIAPPVDIPMMDTPVSCGPLELRCGGACVAVLRDPMNCGDCGAVCPAVAGATATCMGGRCGYACDATHADCDERPSNGCESERATDRANCGTCGTACPLGAVCQASSCAYIACTPSTTPADAGMRRVWTACPDGCVDMSSNLRNCGACGSPCADGNACVAGSCRPLICPGGMQRIPGGTFTMGSTEVANEQPPHPVTLSTYCMDTTEVTVAAYRSCVDAGICSAAGVGTNCNWMMTGREAHPIVCVTWDQARSLCQWRGGDLPTEAQWEYAARGTDGRRYPWGNGDPGSRLCGNGSQSSTCPVGSYPGDTSPFGLVDMAGNAWEWTLDWYGAYSVTPGTVPTNPTGPSNGPYRVYRGGAWYLNVTPDDQFRAASRSSHEPSIRLAVGFRCAWMP